MNLHLHISIGEKRKGKHQAVIRHTSFKTCFLFFSFFLLSIHELLAQQHPDLPNPSPNIQTATIGSLVIPMDNNKQNIGSPFNLKAYGLIHALLLNDIPVKWIIRSGKGKDSVDFSATAERLYPTYVSAAMNNFMASEFIIDSTWVNNPAPTTGKTATEIITTYGNNVAVFRLTQNVPVDVRYTLNFRPKIAIFNNGGNQNIHTAILNAGGVSNYITTGAGVFAGIFQCFTFASEPHWVGSYPADTPITNNIKNFVLAGGNFLAECRGVLTYENLSEFHTDSAITIRNATVTNNYFNNDLAYMQFQGALKANEGGSERNWTRSPGSSWVPGFYYGVSDNNKDTIVASGAHLINPDSAGGNVFYLGGHDYSPFNTLLQINAARLYLNATLVPTGRPGQFTISIGSNTTICPGSSVTLGGSPTGPAGATYTWMPASTLNNSTLANPIATPASSSTYYVSVYKNGCLAQDHVTVTVEPPMSAVMTNTNVSCNGGSNGSISAVVNGGNGPYSYLWSNGQTTSVATGLSAGTYSVAVTSALGCMKTFTDTLTEPVAPLSSSITPTNVSCYGGSNGVAASTASGGTAGYTYLWNNGQTTATASGLTAGNYSLTTTDTNGCSTVSVVSLTAPPILSSSVTSTNVSCSGGSNGTANVTVTGGTAGYTYLWNTGQINPVDTGLSAGNYSVTVTDTNGCIATSSVVITQPLTAISTTLNQTNELCRGGNTGSASASATGGTPSYMYQWNNGQTGSTISGLTAGNYSVTVTDSNGCESITAFSITEPSAIAVSLSSVPAAACNSNGTATATASGGTPSYSYAWSNGQTTNAITGLFPGIYVVTITDSNNCIHSDFVAVVSNPSIVPANAGPDKIYCFGDSIQLNASGGVGYSWYPSVGLSNPGISNPMASPTMTTTYYIYVTDTDGCIGADSMTIFVNSLPLVDAGANLNICPNSSDTLHATGGILYSWFPSTGLNDPNISNPVVSTASTTTYTVTVTDARGCVASDSATVMVNPFPPANAGNNVSICSNDTSALAASGGITYSWSPVAGLNNPNISNPLASPVSSTVYTVTVMDSNGCSATADVTISVNPLPLVSTGTDLSICLNNSCTLNASGGINYSWFPSTGLSNPNISNPIASPLVTTSYIIYVTDTNGCGRTDSMRVKVNPLPVVDAGAGLTICRNSSNNLHASGGVNYVWSPVTGLNDPINPDPIASPASTTTYTVTVTDVNGCMASDTTTVQVNPIPVPAAGNNATICLNDSITLLASGGINYTWSPVAGLSNPMVSNPVASPAFSTTFTVTVSDSNGCSATADVIIIVNPLPLVSAGANHNICFNNTCSLNASGGINYSWVPSTGLSDTTSSSPVATPAVTTTYTVTANDANGCINTSSAVVSINPLPVITVNAATICLGTSTALTANGGIQYTWSNGQSGSAITVSPGTTTNYSVIGIDVNGCIDTGMTTVTVTPVPTVYAGEDTTIEAGTEIQMHATGTGTSYQWLSESVMDCSTCLNPHVTPLHTTQYLIMTTDGNGCRNSDTITISVEDCLALYVPNAFTPVNNDQLNDVFYVKGTCIDKFEFFIYDRWGLEIFESSDQDKGWDGTYMGQPVQQDVYVWVAKARSFAGLDIYKTGRVTVVK